MRLSQTVSAKTQQSQRPDPRQILASEILAWTAPEVEVAIERELAENPALELREEAGTAFPFAEGYDGGAGHLSASPPGMGGGLTTPFRRCATETLTGSDSAVGARDTGGSELLRLPMLLRSHDPAALLDPFEMLAGQTTLRDHLRAQVGQILSDLRRESREEGDPDAVAVAPVLRYLIECVDERGYLVADPCEVAGRFRVAGALVETAVRLLQRMEPSGVGARDLRECLVLQCVALRESGEMTGALPLNLLTHCWDDLVAHREARIAQRLQRTVEQVRRAIFFLQSRLVPHPAAGAFRVKSAPTGNVVPLVRPDVIFVRLPDGIRVEAIRHYDEALRIAPLWEQWATNSASTSRDGHSTAAHRAVSNRAAPQVGGGGREAREEQSDATRRYAREQVEQARTFLTGLARRGRTLNRLARALAERQHAFLETGDRAFLRPLTQQALAEELGLDESVVSRAIADKWAQLPSGDIVPLDAFFGTANAAREALVRLVADEDSANPYSDDEIAARLATLGFPVARRTVAKYRSQERILPNRLRRRLK